MFQKFQLGNFVLFLYSLLVSLRTARAGTIAAERRAYVEFCVQTWSNLVAGDSSLNTGTVVALARRQNARGTVYCCSRQRLGFTLPCTGRTAQERTRKYKI